MLNNEEFDKKVERFLKKQMTVEEEESFKAELSDDPEKLSQAQIIALTIKQMRYEEKEADKQIVDTIRQMNETIYEPIIDGVQIEEFDKRVEKYLKCLMNGEEEREFQQEISSSQYLCERAKLIALTLKQMKLIRKEHDQLLISQIENMTEKEFHSIIGESQKVRLKSSKLIKFVRYSISIAAIFLIVFGGYRYNIYYQTTELGTEYLTRIPNGINEALRGNENEKTLLRLSNLFANVEQDKDLKYTIQDLESLYKLSVRDEYNEYTNYYVDISWNLIIAYLKDGQSKKAKPIIEKLIKDNEDTPIAEVANELLQDIENL